MKKLILSITISFGLIFISCDKTNNIDTISDAGLIIGTWVDSESNTLQFVEFYPNGEAKFGLYNKNSEQYDPFHYRLFDNQVAIDFSEDNDPNETMHHLTFLNKDTIEISNLTVTPENPDKIYYRRDIITDRQNDTITIGLNDIYYDFENGFRLQIDSIASDSRCPYGAECFWAGNADVRLDLIVDGNFHYQFTLNTTFRNDTIIDKINYKLVQLSPHPVINKTIDYQDYKVKIVTENQ